MPSIRTKLALATVAGIVVLGAGGTALATSGGGDDGENTATGPQADRARAAALVLRPGTANSVERDGENGATWEVEVTQKDGPTVDVRLDENYKLVVVEGDNEDEQGQ